MSGILRSGLAILAAILAGCTYQGPANNLLVQRGTWFSYINGDDIRAACAAGAPETWRLVYNADFNRQVRSFDVLPGPGGGALLRQTIDRGIVFDGRGRDFTQIGAPDHTEEPLSAAEVEQLGGLLAASGAFGPPPVGLKLDARRHWWLAVGCHDGRYFLTAWAYPSPRFDQIRFVDFLRQRDPSGIRFPVPVYSNADYQLRSCAQQTREGLKCFTNIVGEDGLVGIVTIDGA
jgi:hypothetical protein